MRSNDSPRLDAISVAYPPEVHVVSRTDGSSFWRETRETETERQARYDHTKSSIPPSTPAIESVVEDEPFALGENEIEIELDEDEVLP